MENVQLCLVMCHVLHCQEILCYKCAVQFNVGDVYCGNLYKEEIFWKL
jgi:hypothetical protein